MKYLIFVMAMCVGVQAYGQDRFATSVFIGGVIADDITTWRNMRAGATETNPLYAFARDEPKGVLISFIATDIATLWIAHRYNRTHPKIVRVVLFTLGGVRGANAVHNARLWSNYENRPIFIPDRH